MKKVLIRTKGLSKIFNNGKDQIPVIKNMDIEVYEKDFTVIMGSSGSGKSTLLYLLSGLDNITEGEVWFGSNRIDRFKEKEMSKFRRKNMGFVFQGFNLVPNLTLRQNIAISGYLTNESRKKVDELTKDLLNRVGLQDKACHLPSQVSGGQQQRAAIARAMISSPTVLFADEPTGALNSVNGENVLDMMTEINEKGQSVVMVTHDIKAACRGSRLVFIKDGNVAGDLALGKFKHQDKETREKQVFEFLTGKGW